MNEHQKRLLLSYCLRNNVEFRNRHNSNGLLIYVDADKHSTIKKIRLYLQRGKFNFKIDYCASYTYLVFKVD